MKTTLTPRSLAALLKDRPERRVIVRDQSPQSPVGFVMRLSPTAANYYVVARKRWHLVGDADALSLEEARRVARVLLGRIAEGRDPSDERRADRERRKTESAERRERRKATTSGPTLVGLVRRSIEAKEKRLSSRTVKEWTRSLVRDISPSPLGQMQASAIKRAELADWLKSLGDSGGPHQSDRVLTLIRASYRYALDEEAAGHSFGILRDPTRGLHPLVRRQDQIRTRSLIADAPSERDAFRELIEFWKKSEAMRLEDRVLARLILLCGTRREETQLARWSEIDLDGVPTEGVPPTWKIPKEHRKGGETGRAAAITVPLSSLALVELKELRAARPKDSLVFESVRANPGERLTKHTIADLTFHDLRRSASDALGRLGASNEERALVLGHATAKGVEKHYSFARPIALHARLLQMLADAILKHLGAEPARVLPGAARFGA